MSTPPDPIVRTDSPEDIVFSFEATPAKGNVSAVLRLPDGADTLLVLGHGAGAGMYHKNLEALATGLAARGIGTLRYQFPFMERGGGRDSEATSLATVRSAVREAKTRVPNLRLLAGGQSYGGRMTSLAAGNPAGEDDPMNHLDGLVYFNFPLHAPGKPSTHRATHLPKVTLPQLFISGTRDALARLDLLEETVALAGAKLHCIDTANHGFRILKRTRVSEEDPIEEACRVTREWVDAGL